MRKHQVEVQVLAGRPNQPADRDEVRVGHVEIRHAEGDFRLFVPRPGRGGVGRQPERLVAGLVEIAIDARRDGEDQTPLRRHLGKPAELGVGGVAVAAADRRRPALAGLQLEAGRNHQRRVGRRTRQGENALHVNVADFQAVAAARGKPTGVEQHFLKHAVADARRELRLIGRGRAGAASVSPGACKISAVESGCDTS